MIKTISIFFILTAFAAQVFAAEPTPSQRISQAVDAIAPLALTGVAVHKISASKARTVKSALRELAIKADIYETENEWNWVGSDSSIWNIDESAFGQTTMKAAYSYIMSQTDEYASDEEVAEYKKNLPAARNGFKLFLGTGVLFGVVPMGAVQCGVQFPALAIIDPHTGNIYIFSREGSGC